MSGLVWTRGAGPGAALVTDFVIAYGDVLSAHILAGAATRNPKADLKLKKQKLAFESRQRMPADFPGWKRAQQMAIGFFTQQTGFPERAGQFFHLKNKVHRGAQQAFLAFGHAAAFEHLAVMHHDPEAGLGFTLQPLERFQHAADGKHRLLSFPPAGEKTVAEKFVDVAAAFFDELF